MSNAGRHVEEKRQVMYGRTVKSSSDRHIMTNGTMNEEGEDEVVWYCSSKGFLFPWFSTPSRT